MLHIIFIINAVVLQDIAKSLVKKQVNNEYPGVLSQKYLYLSSD